MPVQDAAEKALMKVATRGVVRLFNAVSKAQKQNLEESVVGKRAKVSCWVGIPLGAICVIVQCCDCAKPGGELCDPDCT